MPLLLESAQGLAQAYIISSLNKSGGLSTKNWRESVFKDADKISGETIMEKYLVREHSCVGAPYVVPRSYRFPQESSLRFPRRSNTLESVVLAQIWVIAIQRQS